MKFRTLIKLLITAQAVVLFTYLSTPPLGAEFIFKKDGSIVKGSIVSDEPLSISIKNENGVTEWVNRKDIIRIIYTDLYMGKVYVRLTTGEVVEGFQVDEDRDNYFFRREINNTEEFAIPRKKVMFIARTNPTDLKGNASTNRIIMSWSPPFKPAESYRIYMRDVKNNEANFRMAGETTGLVYEIKELQKSWSYEFYATAISDTGEESLPSEKVIINTRPEAPQKLRMSEKYSDNGNSVTLILTWENVTDPVSRVQSYSIYELKNSGKKMMGNSQGNVYEIRDFPAEGRHWFALVAVNDLLAESEDVKAVYDAGYKIYLRSMGSYIYPLGVMLELGTCGFGGVIDAGIARKNWSIGLETGYFTFICAEYVKSMFMVPVLLEYDYRLHLFYSFSFRPVLKAGCSYNTIEYEIRQKSDPLLTGKASSSSFDPLAAAGGYLQFDINENFNVYAGAEYSAIFQKSGRMNYAAFSFGAGIIF